MISAYRRERPTEPWPIISGNTRPCASNLSPLPPPLSLSIFTISTISDLTPYDINSFTLTPPRMRMIVDAFKDTLELGLEKPKQVVVRLRLCLVIRSQSYDCGTGRVTCLLPRYERLRNVDYSCAAGRGTAPVNGARDMTDCAATR
jgi:hypothetical protein